MASRMGKVRTLREVAERLGVTFKRITRASESGDIRRGRDGRYDLKAVAFTLMERAHRGKNGSFRLAQDGAGIGAEPVRAQLLEWDIRFRRARAIREERLAASEAAELVPRSAVTEFIIRRELEFKDRCLAMPREVALLFVCGCPQGKKASELEVILREKMVEILRVLAKPEDVGRVQGKAANR